jgi:hypothetical protein
MGRISQTITEDFHRIIIERFAGKDGPGPPGLGKQGLFT